MALNIPTETETTVILLKLLLNNLALAAGITRNAAIRTMPTSFNETTTVTAIRMLRI